MSAALGTDAACPARVWVVWSGLLPSLLATGCAGEALQRPPGGAHPPGAATAVRRGAPEVWFEDLREPLTVTDAQAEALLGYVAAAAGQGGTPGRLPPALEADALPRIVFLSVSDGSSPARVAVGAGTGLARAVEAALDRIGARRRGRLKARWIKLDIVRTVHVQERADPDRPLQLDRSLYGLAWGRTSGVALLPGEVVGNMLLDRGQRLQPERIRAYLKRRRAGAGPARRSPPVGTGKVHRFSTLGFFTDGKEVVRLYRGHRSFQRPTREELLTAARMGGRYLTASVGRDGRFVYDYRADTAEVSPSYNIVRHAGAVYAMLELYEVTRDRRLLRAAERAIAYLLRRVRPSLGDAGYSACLIEGGFAKLGGNALAAIALARYTRITGDRRHVPVMVRLGRWIRACQVRSGEFVIHKQAYADGQVVAFTSAYAPGEAILALTRIHRIDPKDVWLDTAERAARYLIEVRDRNDVKADHWQLYALDELHRRRPREAYLRQALRIGRAIVASQMRDPRHPDWAGGFYEPPRSTPAAIRMEGLSAAYRLVRDFGTSKDAESFLEPLLLGNAFQLGTQIYPESAMYLSDPQRVLGGVRKDLSGCEIRIDYVQHTISSLLGLYRILGRAM